MMNYEIFKEVFAEQFLGYMPDDFANHKVEVRSLLQINQTVDYLELIPPDGRSGQVIPSLRINDMYAMYQDSEDLKSTLEIGAFHLAGLYKSVPLNASKRLLEEGKDRIVMMLVNTEQNRELLETVPHREFRDLSIVYRIVAGMDEQGIETGLVKNEFAAKLGMSEQELYEAAVVNTRRMFPPVIKNMNDLIREILLADGMPEEFADILVEEMPPEKSMYVLTNERRINGAASMLYENELHKLAEQLGTDLYIMPSSIHEVIAVSTDMGEPYELAEMVAAVNMEQVQLSERLSNQVYHYDKDLRKLTLATDTPNKRLDGIVAEPQLIYETKQSR